MASKNPPDMLELARGLLPPRQKYAMIRKDHPDEPFGNHWDNIGVYVGEGLYGDPKVVGGMSDYEVTYRWARKSIRKAEKTLTDRTVPE